ncbi:DUF2922 domain-containing protein [Alkalicoccus daliensis]|uniref:DUF2922 domain-containing protein n=1 Tax=Alkalicoccus daliensis TaxID=745820 RepID=A0A1H0CSQ6_9BACI|nr:DUF2922 domain-containing protein [Alkalicoccus daliensis]SDN60835.1 Protein of unknown function [Alkalicoccus daliensis]
MTKRLELLFTTEAGTSATIAVDSPKEPVDAAAVTQAMDEILAADVFFGASGNFVEKRGARLVERNVDTIDIGI